MMFLLIVFMRVCVWRFVWAFLCRASACVFRLCYRCISNAGSRPKLRDIDTHRLRLRSAMARRLGVKKLLELDKLLLKLSTFSLINWATSPILTSLYVFLLGLSSVICGMVFVFFLSPPRSVFSSRSVTSLHDTWDHFVLMNRSYWITES